MAKTFTEEETAAAKRTGSKHHHLGEENQARRGAISGASRRTKAIQLALAGTTSRKTAKTAYMSLLHTMALLKIEDLQTFNETIYRNTKKHSLLQSFLLACEDVQRVAISKNISNTLKGWLAIPHLIGKAGRKSIKVYTDGVSSNPFESFKNVCIQVEDFVKEILTNKKSAANHSNTPIANTLVENECGLEAESTKSGSCSTEAILSKRTPLRLPTELYAHIRTIVTKMLPKNDCRQVIGKLADCFKRHDIDRFEYILSEASKNRNIFANVGKGDGKRSRNVLIDTSAGAIKFLEKYGVASSERHGFLYA